MKSFPPSRPLGWDPWNHLPRKQVACALVACVKTVSEPFSLEPMEICNERNPFRAHIEF